MVKKNKAYLQRLSSSELSHNEVQAQAVSYTTGVPAMIGAKMILSKKWYGSGVFNMEEFDALPFMEELNKQGLPWKVVDLDGPLD